MFSYLFLRLGFGIIKVLPLNFIIPLTKVLNFVLKRLLSYRKDVILSNLTNSFPEKSKAEIEVLKSEFYVVLSRYIVESIFRMSKGMDSFERFAPFHNLDEIRSSITKNKPIIILCSHFGNWEIIVPSLVKKLDIESFGIYKPINNKLIDKYIISKRGMPKLTPTPMKDTLKVMKSNRDKACLIFLIADQGPANLNNVEWVKFLNQETPCLNGAQKLSKIFSAEVFYISTQPNKKEYRSSLIKIDHHNSDHIIKEYMNLLEKDIVANPAYWLWSHKRWKRAKI